MDVARDDMELLVVTENGYGKRTSDRPVPQDQPRRQGRQDDQPDREARAAWPGRWSSASTRSWSSSARAAWCSAPASRASASTGRAAPGRARDEPQRRGPRVAPWRWSSSPRRTTAAEIAAPGNGNGASPALEATRREAPGADGADGGSDRRQLRRRRVAAGAGGPRGSARRPAWPPTSSPFANLAIPEKGGGPYFE